MDIQTIIYLVLGQLAIGTVGVITTYKLTMYKIDQNKQELNEVWEDLKVLESMHHAKNIEISSMKQLLETTNSMVKEIHSKFFKIHPGE